MQDPDLVVPRPRAGAREWVGLGVLALPAFVIALDFSVLNLAVPEISRQLMPSATASRPSCWPTNPASSSQAASDPPSSTPRLLPWPGASYATRTVTDRPCGIPSCPGRGRPMPHQTAGT